jgi:hypothetical protein
MKVSLMVSQEMKETDTYGGFLVSDGDDVAGLVNVNVDLLATLINEEAKVNTWYACEVRVVNIPGWSFRWV